MDEAPDQPLPCRGRAVVWKPLSDRACTDKVGRGSQTLNAATVASNVSFICLWCWYWYGWVPGEVAAAVIDDSLSVAAPLDMCWYKHASETGAANDFTLLLYKDQCYLCASALKAC